MLRHLTERHDWQRCELHPLRAGSPLLAARVPAGLDDEILAFEPCLVVQVPPAAREAEDFLPSKIRYNLRHFRRRAERARPRQLRDCHCRHALGVRRGCFSPARRTVAAQGSTRRARRSGDPTLSPRGRAACCTAPGCSACTRCAWTGVSSPSCTAWLRSAAPISISVASIRSSLLVSPGTLIFGHSIRQAVARGA